MPVVVRLRYCVIRMYFQDHNPPHFHVDTPDAQACYGIRELDLIEGSVDRKAEKEALAWAQTNRFKLWQL